MTWEPVQALVPHPLGGAFLIAGTVLVAGLVAGALPLRGGGGQHAHAGPGALTVWQLYGTGDPRRAERAEPDEDPDGTDRPGTDRPGRDSPRAQWPGKPVWPEGIEHAPRLLHPGELWDEPIPRSCLRPDPETDHVGRHRLVEPPWTWSSSRCRPDASNSPSPVAVIPPPADFRRITATPATVTTACRRHRSESGLLFPGVTGCAFGPCSPGFSRIS